MLSPQTFNPGPHELTQLQKLGNKFSMADKNRQAKPEVSQPENALSWFTVEEKDGSYRLMATPNTAQVDVTSVTIYADEVKSPKMLNFLGYKIDLKAKIDGFMENYAKNYALSKSHNLMVARFAELKTSFYGYLLSMLGATSEDVRKLQKKAIEGAVKQNKMLFEENEYNGELLALVGGGGKKQMRAQQRVISEIRNQLTIQMRNLGLGDYYTARRVIEVQIEQCRKILDKFNEEKTGLEYQLIYFGVN